MARMPNTIVVIVINIFSKIEKLKSLESNPVDVSDRTIGLSPTKEKVKNSTSQVHIVCVYK